MTTPLTTERNYSFIRSVKLLFWAGKKTKKQNYIDSAFIFVQAKTEKTELSEGNRER